MHAEGKGMTRYLEMLAKAHTDGQVPRDIRFRRAKVTSKPCVLVRERFEPKPNRTTLEDRYAQHRKAQIASALKVCDPTDAIRSSGNGL